MSSVCRANKFVCRHWKYLTSCAETGFGRTSSKEHNAVSSNSRTSSYFGTQAEINSNGQCTGSFSSKTMRSLSSLAGNVASEESSGSGGAESASDIFRLICTALDTGEAPQRQHIQSFLSRCNVPEDIDNAQAVLRRLKRQNVRRRKQFHDFSDETANAFVKACIAAGVADRALLALRESNDCGLVPSRSSANLLLADSVARKDLSMALKVTRSMAATHTATPSSYTVNTLLGVVIDRGDTSRLLSLAKDMAAMPGVKLSPAVRDAVLAQAAKEGRWKDGLLVAECCLLTPASALSASAAVAMAKLCLLDGSVDKAAQYLRPILDGDDTSNTKEILHGLTTTWLDELPREKNGTVKGVTLDELRSRVTELAGKITTDSE